MKKTLFTLNLNPDDYRDITDITYPLLKHYAFKMGADFHVIDKRKFPEWPPNYEKMQIYELGQKMKNDWNIFIDCDALVHPDAQDFTEHLKKDTCCHHGSDMATFRWKYDRFFWRDGRHIGSATWFCIASDWCIELFKPLDDMTPKEVADRIFPTANELKNGVSPIRLVEDFAMSRNIAQYGLKFTTLKDINKELGVGRWIQGTFEPIGHFWHKYAVPKEEKVVEMKQIVKAWGVC